MRNASKALLTAAVLMAGVVVGVIFDSWQVIVAAAAIALVLGLYWVLAAAQSASRALRETRTELRRVSSVGDDAAEQLRALSKSLLEVTTQVSELRSDVAANGASSKSAAERIDELGSETSSALTDLMGAVRAGSSEQQTQDEERRALVDELLGNVRDSGQVLAKTKQQLNRTVRRQLEIYGMIELIEGKLTARIDQFLDEAQRELRKNRGEISTLAQRIDGIEWAPSERGTMSMHDAGSFDLERYLYYLSYHVPREVEAQQQLQRVYQPDGLMPLLGGWALTPTGTLDIVNAIADDRPKTVVECGSGTSTVWFALAARENSEGHVYALEHDPAFAEATRARLEDHGLTEFATVVDAPIVEHDSPEGPFEWYDIRGLSDVRRIDVLVIDGPPKALGDLRGGAIALLHHRFANRMHVFADDVNRPAERELIKNWLEQFPELHTEISSTPVQAHLSWRIAEEG